jgi:hypothetical protein
VKRAPFSLQFLGEIFVSAPEEMTAEIPDADV